MKISSLRKWAAIAVALWLPSMAATGLAQKVTGFTADQVTMAADGKTVAQSKVYFSGGNMRTRGKRAVQRFHPHCLPA